VRSCLRVSGTVLCERQAGSACTASQPPSGAAARRVIRPLAPCVRRVPV